MPVPSVLLASCPIDPQANRSRDTGLDAIQIWPSPALQTHTCAGGWRERAADLFLELDQEGDEVYRGTDTLGWDVPLGPLLLRIPEEIRTALRAQPRAFSWPVLQLLHGLPDGLELAREQPSLVGLLAAKLADAGDREEATEALREGVARGRPVLLLPLVGLPPQRRLLNALLKTVPRDLHIAGVELVLRVLHSRHDRVRQLLLTLPQLRGDVLVALDRPRLLEGVSDELLADPEPGLPLWMLLEDLADAQDAGLLPALGPLRSRQQLAHLHEALRPLHERWEQQQQRAGTAASGASPPTR